MRVGTNGTGQDNSSGEGRLDLGVRGVALQRVDDGEGRLPVFCGGNRCPDLEDDLIGTQTAPRWVESQTTSTFRKRLP